MITAQDVREKTFEKSKLGGYDMAEVDEFLEQIADELTSSQKEVAVLKSKMKVLVDKIEEYRSNENALNQTLLSAQKLATQIESEARTKSEQLMAETEKKVTETIGTIKEQTIAEEKRLNDAKAATSKFFEGIRAMCNAQLKNLDSLEYAKEAKQAVQETASSIISEVKSAPVKDNTAADDFESKFSRQAADIEEAVRSIEASVARQQPEPRVHMDFSSDIEAARMFSADKDSTQPFRF